MNRRKPIPRPTGYVARRIDVNSVMDNSAARVPMFRGRAGMFVPRNRRHWKDAIRHVWFQLAIIARRPVHEIRPMAPDAINELVTKGRRKRKEGWALVRRLRRLTVAEIKPKGTT